MKLGFVSAILSGSTYEEMIDIASRLGYQCVEAASWPGGSIPRGYTNVCHIDAEKALADDVYANHVLDYAKEKGVQISSLSCYVNQLDPDPEKRKAYNAHLMAMIEASAKLGIGLVTTFIGRDPKKSVDENLPMVKEVWPPILEHAKKLNVKIGIENCPLLFGPAQWPGGMNVMSNPVNWRKVFEVLPYDNLGLNYDPSHLVWQMIDYIQPIYEFKDRIFHVHFKDTKIWPDKLKDVGIMALPLDYMSAKLPGLGDVNWGSYVAALTDIGYDGCACVEVEDTAFEGSFEKVMDSLTLSKRYLDQFVI